MVAEALEYNYHKTIFTRQDWIDRFRYCENVDILPDLPYKGDKKADNPFDWGSGPHACNLAATMKPEEIHLYGFDLWGIDEKINNIYKDTRNYDSSERSPIDPRFWIYQLAKCFEYYPNVQWIQHQPSDWKIPESWNYSNLTITTFPQDIS